MMKYRIVFVLLLLLVVGQASAQTRREVVKAQVDSVLQKRYHRVSYDTNFVTRPDARLTLKVRANVSGCGIRARGSLSGVRTIANLNTDEKATLSVGVNYQGISAGLAINPSSLSGRNKDYELNLNAYSNRYSIDASYQMSKTMAGHIESDGEDFYMDRGFVETEMLNVAGYYTFNYKRFSYPAAFTQTYIQRRSAGSWLAGFSYQGGHIKTTDEAPSMVPESRIFIGHFGIGGGYAYNLVAGKKWLFHISALPTLVLFNLNNITVDGERKKMHIRFPDMIFNERIAVVRNFSPRYFAGLTVVVSNTLFHNSQMTINQNKWRSRLFFGIRF